MSGVRVTYDFNRKEGERAVEVEVRCAQCDIPSYETLEDGKTYNVIVPQFLLDRGDGHIFRENNAVEPIRLQKNDRDVFVQYLAARDFVYPEIEGRITVIEYKSSAGYIAHSFFLTSITLFIARSII